MRDGVFSCLCGDYYPSAAAYDQISFPSLPSLEPPDPPPEVRPQNAGHPVPALSLSKLGHLQGIHGHLAAGGQRKACKFCKWHCTVSHLHKHLQWRNMWRTHLNNGVRTWKKKKMNMLTWPPPSGNKMVSCSLMWNPLIVSFFPFTSCFSSAGQQETTEVTNWKGTREITIIIVSYKIYNQKHYMLLKGLQLFKCVQDFSLIQDFIKVWLCKGQFMWQQVQRLKT